MRYALCNMRYGQLLFSFFWVIIMWTVPEYVVLAQLSLIASHAGSFCTYCLRFFHLFFLLHRWIIFVFFCFNSTGAVVAQAVNSVLSYVKEACTIWKDIFTLSCLTLIFTWRGEQNGSDLLASGWWKLQRRLVFMKFSTILVSTILKRLRSDCARCDGDGGKVTKGARQIETVLKWGGRRGGGIIKLIHDIRHLSRGLGLMG